MHAERLAPYLADKLGEPVRVVGVSQAFPGLSRETLWSIQSRF